MYNWQIKICRRLDSNCGSQVSEATALPTEPQPLPRLMDLFFQTLSGLRLICDLLGLIYFISQISAVNHSATAPHTIANLSRTKKLLGCCKHLVYPGVDRGLVWKDVGRLKNTTDYMVHVHYFIHPPKVQTLAPTSNIPSLKDAHTKRTF